MRMTRERKVYAAVLAVAVTALGADKFIFAPPESRAMSQAELLVHAPAPDAQPAPLVARPEPQISPTAQAGTLVPLAALAERVQHVTEARRLEPEQVIDIFHTPAGWAKTLPNGPDAAAVFAARHQLVAVLKSSRGGVAVVTSGASRKSLRIGQQLDGFTLVAIADRSITLHSPQGTVELPLPADAKLDPQSITASGR